MLDNLQGRLEKMFLCFSTNHSLANSGKCHLSTSSKMPVNIHNSNTEISNEEKVRLLGVNLEGRFNFDFLLKKKASKKYHVLARMCN